METENLDDLSFEELQRRNLIREEKEAAQREEQIRGLMRTADLLADPYLNGKAPLAVEEIPGKTIYAGVKTLENYQRG